MIIKKYVSLEIPLTGIMDTNTNNRNKIATDTKFIKATNQFNQSIHKKDKYPISLISMRINKTDTRSEVRKSHRIEKWYSRRAKEEENLI